MLRCTLYDLYCTQIIRIHLSNKQTILPPHPPPSHSHPLPSSGFTV